MSDKSGFQSGLDAGRRAAEEPVAVRRRRSTAPGQERTRRNRDRDRPPLAAFVVIAIAAALILGNASLQKALGLSGPTPEVVGIFLSGIGVMMLRPPRRR